MSELKENRKTKDKKEYFRNYYKMKLQEEKGKTYECGCGSKFTYYSKAQHMNTKKHKKWVAEHGGLIQEIARETNA